MSEGNGTRNPRSLRPYAIGMPGTSPIGEKMNTPPQEGTPAPTTPDYAAVIEEQKAVIAALNDKVNSLEKRAGASEERIAALSNVKAAPAPSADQAAAAKSELDKAYEKVLADLGIKKE